MTNSLPQQISPFNLKPNSSDEKWYVFDLETNGLYDDVTEIFCIVIYDVTRQQTITYRPDSIDRAIESLNNADVLIGHNIIFCLLYTSPSPRDRQKSRMPSSA